MERKVTIGKWLNEGFALYKENFLLVFATTAIAVIGTVVVWAIVAGIFGMMLGPLLGTIIAAVCTAFVSGPLFVGLYGVLLSLIDSKGEKPSIGSVFRGFDNFMQPALLALAFAGIFIVGTILGQIPWIGFLLSLIASLAAGMLSMFAFPSLSAKGLGFMEALQESADILKSSPLEFFLFYICATIIGFLGIILLGFGVLLTLPIALSSYAAAYWNLTSGAGEKSSTQDAAQAQANQ